jgi:hypothetical protein
MVIGEAEKLFGCTVRLQSLEIGRKGGKVICFIRSDEESQDCYFLDSLIKVLFYVLISCCPC